LSTPYIQGYLHYPNQWHTTAGHPREPNGEMTTARLIEYHLTTIRLAKQEGIDLTNYKHIIIIHAGKDEAVGGTANDIWSHCLMSKGCIS
jgi:hypothetical protein